MKNEKRTKIARIAVAVIGIIAVGCMALILAALLSGCGPAEPAPAEVSRDLLDLVVDPERQEAQTDYAYRFNVWEGEFQLVPEIKTVTVPQKYRAYYRINYEDETVDYVWVNLTREEFAQLKSKEV